MRLSSWPPHNYCVGGVCARICCRFSVFSIIRLKLKSHTNLRASNGPTGFAQFIVRWHRLLKSLLKSWSKFCMNFCLSNDLCRWLLNVSGEQQSLIMRHLNWCTHLQMCIITHIEQMHFQFQKVFPSLCEPIVRINLIFQQSTMCMRFLYNFIACSQTFHEFCLVAEGGKLKTNNIRKNPSIWKMRLQTKNKSLN